MASGQRGTNENAIDPYRDDQYFAHLQVPNLPSKTSKGVPIKSDDDRLFALAVTELPDNTFEDALKTVIEQVAPVELLHIAVNFESRAILNFGYVVVKGKYLSSILEKNKFFLDGRQMRFYRSQTFVEAIYLMKQNKKVFRPPVEEWPHDVRPGHPAYKLLEPRDEPFDLDKPNQDEPTAHRLTNNVLHFIFKRFNVCQLLRIERTCRRWQWIIHQILGGHKFVNMSDRTSIWGNFGLREYSLSMYLYYGRPKPYFGPSFVQKILILNSQTLEHLIICNVSIDWDNVRRAIKQCCPKLNHYFFVGRKFPLSSPYFRADFVPVDLTESPGRCKYTELFVSVGNPLSRRQINDVPRCICTNRIDATIDNFAARLESNPMYEDKCGNSQLTKMMEYGYFPNFPDQISYSCEVR